MEAIGACAIALAALGGALVGRWLCAASAGRMHKAERLGLAPRERAIAMIEAGAAPLKPLAWRILGVPAVARTAESALCFLHVEGRLSTGSLMAAFMLVVACLSLAAFALTRSAAFAVAAGCLCVVGSWLAVRHKAEAADERMRDEVPDALRSLADSFRSGHSLVQTMQQASRDLKGKMGQRFAACAQRLEMGDGVAEALLPLRTASGVPELAFVSVALDVQHQCGGSIAPVIESARESVEGELELARNLRVQTAQAKLSASIVTLMPFVLIAFFSLASPGFLAPFFESPLGLLLLTVALAMQVAGVIAVRRICRVDS